MGLLRIVLALSVIAGHAETTLFGLTWVDEFYAVQAFFTISGFYMALVLNGKYAGLPVSAFYKSRALRIYPGYFAAVAFMLFVNGSELSTAVHALKPLSRLFVGLQNTVIFGQDLTYVFCMREKTGSCAVPWLVTADPPGWSLSVELLFYLVAPFLVRQPRRLVILIAVGTVYLLLTNAFAFPITTATFNIYADFSLRYYFYPASFIFFGAGALAFHLRRLSELRLYPLLIAAVVAFGFIQTVMPAWHLMIFALAIPDLFRLTQTNRYDRLLGEFSYPLYILHWPVLTYVKSHPQVFAPLQPYVGTGSIVAVLSILGATVVFFAIDLPMDRIRRPRSDAVHVAREEPAWAKVLLAVYLVAPFVMLAAIAR